MLLRCILPSNSIVILLWLLASIASPQKIYSENGLPLYYWQQHNFANFGDVISLKLVERIVGEPVEIYRRLPNNKRKKLLAIGSILSFASDGDVVWGTGINGKLMNPKHYFFSTLDIRAIRGPLTRKFLMDNFGIESPEVYGDPALLFPYFFPEFQRSEFPSYKYIFIPHYSEERMYPKDQYANVVYATDPWEDVIRMILDSELVISSTLHGLVIAEAYGIPARMLRVTNNEPLFKYQDYYLGTGRPHFQMAYSIEEALEMGGEVPIACDLEKLYEAFPREFWIDFDFKPLHRP